MITTSTLRTVVCRQGLFKSACFTLPLATVPNATKLGLGLGLFQGQHHQRFVSSSSTLQLYNAFRKPVLPHALPQPGIVAHQHLKMALGSNHFLAQSSRYRSHWIAAGAATMALFEPVIWSRSVGGLLSRNVAHCAAATASTPTPPNLRSTPPYSSSRIPHDNDPLIDTKELSFGAAMGLCSGYLFKKLGKMFLLVVGLGFVCLQLLSNSGYVKVDWSLVESKFKNQLDLDKDGKVTVKDAQHGFQWIISLLTRNFQFKSTFATGFFLGFRYG